MTTINEAGYEWLCRKAEKTGFSFTATRRIEDNHAVYDVEISDPAPFVPGFTFVGVIEHLSEGNILKSVPGGPELPTEFRNSPPICQHCGLQRTRHSTFVLCRDAAPHDHVQIGRNCLAEYLRDEKAAEDLLAWAALVDEITGKLCRPEFTSTGSGAWYFGIEELVAFSIAYARKFGWVTGAKATETGERSSASEIRDYLCNPVARRGNQHPLCEVEAFADSDAITQEARHVLDYVSGVLATKPDDQTSNYESNLVVLFRQGAVTSDKIALVCSAHRAYGGYKARQEARLQQPGKHVGTVGERGEFRVRVVAIKSLGEGEFGERFLVKMLTETDDQLVWFTGESCSLDENAAEYIWIKATVKEHGEYAGRPQTVVSRVAKIDGPTPPKKPRGKKSVA